MKTVHVPERYTLTLKFEVSAPTQTAARTMGLRISSDLVQRYDLARAPMLKVQPARQPVGA